MAKKAKKMLPMISKKEFDAIYKSVNDKNPHKYTIDCYTLDDGKVVMSVGSIRNHKHTDFIPYKSSIHNGSNDTKEFYRSYEVGIIIANANRNLYNKKLHVKGRFEMPHKKWIS